MTAIPVRVTIRTMAHKKPLPPAEQREPTPTQWHSLWTPDQTAAVLGLTRRRINQMIERGELAAKRIGMRCWLIEHREVLRLLKERKA